jgi:hypothetical protein
VRGGPGARAPRALIASNAIAATSRVAPFMFAHAAHAYSKRIVDVPFVIVRTEQKRSMHLVADMQMHRQAVA